MRRKILIHTFCISFLILALQCAQVSPLTGGKRDTTPPKLIEALPVSKTINFNSEEIILKFDEFIQLKDQNNQIVMQPQLKISPEFEVQGKTLKIKLLNQYLEPGTTYRIDFGRAIADMHENNVLENFDYVFSTGPFIDTLKAKGKISSAFNNKDFGGATIGLYPNVTWFDSLVFKTKPVYTAKSNASGEFQFYNLPKTKYYVYAFEDKNKNFLYDGEAEQIAMLGPPMELLTNAEMDLKIFKEEPQKSFIKKTSLPYYGFTQIIWNKPIRVKVNALVTQQSTLIKQIQSEQLKDTTTIFYKNIEDTLALLVQQLNAVKWDTLKLALPKKPNLKKTSLIIRLNENQGKLVYKQNPILSFSNWMDTSRFELKGISLKSTVDSAGEEITVKGKWLSIHQFEITNALKEGNAYQLKIPKGTFLGVEGLSHDTLKLEFKTQAKTDFGKFNLKLKVSRQQNYVLQLLNEREDITKEIVLPYTVFKGGLALIPFVEILPGNYAVKIIFDNNDNKKWDRGDVTTGRLPEPVIISSKKIKIISDWETEEEIILGEQE